MTFAFSYQMTNTEKSSLYFKILYFYSNKTTFDTNWNNITQNMYISNIKNKESKFLNLTTNFNFTTKDYTSMDCLLFCFNIIISISITFLGLLLYHYKYNN
jgi:hypothetical protein